jgi:anthranilate synthase component 1
MAHVHAGAGIVADSVPENESAEVAAKAGAILAAIAEAEVIYGTEAAR